MGPQPGMHSSKLGLESLTGKLDSFSFQSYVGSSAREEEMSGKDIIR